MSKFVTSDLHFGHKNIIKYCNRPFNSVKKMDNILIQNWNDLVGKTDEIYVLGDFFMKRKNDRHYIESILKRLNGKIHLILGNHDIGDAFFWSKIGVFSISYPYLVVEGFTCIHDPVLSITRKDLKFFCGHVHDFFLYQGNCLNVGVDVHDYKPLLLDDAKQLWEKYCKVKT